MVTQMIRKQIYIQKRQDSLLKRLSRARGLSEAEIIRQAIEHELASAPLQQVTADRNAWQELTAFLDARHTTVTGSHAYRWNRDEIYSDRESRWLRDREQD